MPLSHREFRDSRHFPALDGLRAASILAVVWHHSGPYFDSLPIASRGFLGVDMFFVLSGFLIVTLLLGERDRTGAIDLRAFYARRALRIFPPYYAVLALLAVLDTVRQSSPAAVEFFSHLPFYATYTSNWVVDSSLLALTWSLATEEQFYLVWPPLEKWLGGARRAPAPALVLLIAFLALNQGVNFGLFDALLRDRFSIDRVQLEILQTTFTPICLGVLLAHALHSESAYRVIQTVVRSPLVGGGFVAAIAALANLPGDLSGAPRLALQLLFAALLAHCVVNPSQGLGPLFSTFAMRRIGAISYGIYLYHLFARHAATALLARWSGAATSDQSPPESAGGSFTLFATTLIFSIVLAELSFRWFESPILALKRRFNR